MGVRNPAVPLVGAKIFFLRAQSCAPADRLGLTQCFGRRDQSGRARIASALDLHARKRPLGEGNFLQVDSQQGYRGRGHVLALSIQVAVGVDRADKPRLDQDGRVRLFDDRGTRDFSPHRQVEAIEDLRRVPAVPEVRLTDAFEGRLDAAVLCASVARSNRVPPAGRRPQVPR